MYKRQSLGIEAQVDEVTKKTQYKNANGGEWIDVDFDNAKQELSLIHICCASPLAMVISEVGRQWHSNR